MQKPTKGSKDYYKVILANRKIRQAKLQQKALLDPESIKLTKKQKAAYLGIFWFDANLKKIIFVQKKNVDECVDIGGGWISANYDHADYWKTLDKSEIKEMGGIPSNYRSLPRGKVEYDKSSGKFVVFVGDSINDYLLSCIEVEFKLPMANWTYEKNDDYNVSKAT